MAPMVLFLLLTYFLPESPLWCVQKGQMKRAEHILKWLRGKEYNIMMEWKELLSCAQTSNLGSLKSTFGSPMEVLKAFSSKSMLILLAMFIFQVTIFDFLLKSKVFILVYFISHITDNLWHRTNWSLLCHNIQRSQVRNK